MIAHVNWCQMKTYVMQVIYWKKIENILFSKRDRKTMQTECTIASKQPFSIANSVRFL